MKRLFLTLTDLLAAQIPALKTIDYDLEQLEKYDQDGGRPAVAFPCALVNINITQAEELGGGSQQQTVEITVRVAFEQLVHRSTTAAPYPARNKSIALLDTVDAVYRTLQHYSDDNTVNYEYDSNYDPNEYNVFHYENFTPLVHQSTVRELRADNYTIYRLAFTTTLIREKA